MEGDLTGGSSNVLFSSETLHARSPAMMNTWLIKKREDELLEAFYNYRKTPEGKGEKIVTRLILLARIQVFWKLIKPDYVKRNKTTPLSCEGKANGWNPGELELEETIDKIETYLWDQVKINAIATRKEYDMTDIEQDNAEKGL